MHLVKNRFLGPNPGPIKTEFLEGCMKIYILAKRAPLPSVPSTSHLILMYFKA